MLARIPRSKLRLHSSAAFESPARLAAQLTLPWLCPALSRQPRNSRSIHTQPPETRRPRRPSIRSRHEARSLATTAEIQPTPAPSPFADFAQAWGSRSSSSDLARLKSWDPSNPLVLHDYHSTPTLRGRPATSGLGSDPVELHQNLYACLRVGRTDRANIILERLMSVYNPSAPEIVDAHNIFLQTLFDLAQQESKQDGLAHIEQWYTAKMVQRDIEPNAQTFVTLLRAAMTFLDGDAQEEAIRKYLGMAAESGPHVVEDINYSSEFTDEEWDTLIRAQPEEFEEPPPVEQVQDLLLNTPTARQSLVDHGLLAGDVQAVKPVAQKGLGLDSLRQALASFNDTEKVDYPHDMEGTQEEKDHAYAYARQLRIEKDALDSAVERWRQEDQKLQDMGIHGAMSSKPVQAVMYQWYTALVPLFKKEIDHAKKVLSTPTPENQKDPACGYGPWLEQCKPEKLAAITVSRAVKNCIRRKDEEESAFKVSGMSLNIGNDIKEYLNADAQLRAETFLKKQRQQMRKGLVDKLSRGSTPNLDTSATQNTPIVASMNKIQIPTPMKTKLGALAIELLLQSSTVTVTAENPKTGQQVSMAQAAFQHHMGYQHGKKVGFIKPHHQLLEKLRNDPVSNIQAVRLPMVVEPKAWSSYDDGGYYTISQKVVRQKSSDPAQRQYAHSAIENGDMKKVLAGLDVLGRVPWQINVDVLKTMTQAWNNGEALAGLVPEESSLTPPEEPAADANYQERAKWGKKMQEFENIKGGLHSQRCFQNFQLETARAFAKEKKVFFPHSVDFRGRAYPIPPVLNHIGADLARGLLKFANGKELGSVGLQWLKIHLANLYGYDKASLKDREQFAMDNLSEIYDSATNPLDGRRWWANAEDPWQCLACCMELKNAFDAPDPTRYVSQLPVHQDGTCNGLQHYAALGGDQAGARQVNLEPSDRPQDIYTGVAELVAEMVAKDAADGNVNARFINGHITRKVVKRTVMTNVYGVTFMGAKLQVHDELRHMFPNFQETSSIRSLGSVALYIAYKIFEALGKIFNGAQEIQYWLGECGDRITTSLTAEQIKNIQEHHEGKAYSYDSRFKAPKKMSPAEATKMKKRLEAFRTSIIWTTPLQMPIVQPYRKDTNIQVKTKLQDITVRKKSSADEVDKRKQLQAFPPNFIHSLDATHMLLSALKCNEVGLDFAAVHDSFWTHPSDIPKLSMILRDAFVRMHSEDIITRLAEEFKARYAGSMYCADLYVGSEVAGKIRRWRLQHAKSAGKQVSKNSEVRHQRATLEEVALESQRQQLLNSDNPKDVKKGQQMVTPTSIWLENQDPKALASFRLNLLGQTKDKDSSTFEEVRDKVLDREAEAIAEANNKKNSSGESASTSDALPEDSTPKVDTELAASKPVHGSKGYKYTMTVWIPLTFPPVPKKGDWDVSRLRESEYFFS